MKNLSKRQEKIIRTRIKEYIDAGWAINHTVFLEISESNEIPYLSVQDYYRHVIAQN
jgi:hypothetical protein